MANRYDFGPSLGSALAEGYRSFQDARDRRSKRQRQQEEDEWVREQREHQRGLMPIQREQAQLGLDTSQLGLTDAQRRSQWAEEDRSADVRMRDVRVQGAEFDHQQKVDQAEQDAVLKAMRALKAGDPESAVFSYRAYNPNYAGAIPLPDREKPGNWLIDLDGDGLLDSVNPDDVINFYEPPKFQAPEQHPQLGHGQFGADGKWHGITPTGQGGDTGARGTKIRELIGRGLSYEDASDVVDGRVKVTNPDQFGDVFLVNVTDGSRRRVGGSQTGAAGAQFGIDPNAQRADLPGGQGSSVAQSQGFGLEDAILEGTGPAAMLRQGINNTVGPFMPGRQPFPETNDARASVRFFSQELKASLINNPKFPVAEQQLVATMLPDPDKFLRDPDGELSKVRQLHGFLTQKQEQIARTLETGRVTTQERGDLMNQSEAIGRVLGMVGSLSGQQQGIGYGQGQSVARPQSQLDYQQIPPGTQYMAPDGTTRVKR